MSKQDLQTRTQSHYEAFPFDFLTEEDERNIDSLLPAPFYVFVEKYLKPRQLVDHEEHVRIVHAFVLKKRSIR